MGILQRLLRRGTAPEQRALGMDSGLARGLGLGGLAAERVVTPAAAEALAVVCACVDAVSASLASLPVYVQRRTAEGVTDLPNHPVARLLRRPNDTQTQVDWLAWTVRQTLLHGNSLSIIDWDDAGRPVALLPIPWERVSVLTLPGSGKLVYEVYDLGGGRRRYLGEEVLHIRDASDDGLVGISRLSRASQAVRNALELQTWATSTWANAATPSGALQFEGSLSKDQLAEVRVNLDHRHAGARNARSVLLLTNGAKWQPLSVDPESAEVLQSRRLAVEDCARLFGVPSPIINDLTHGTFTNSETMLRHFASSTLTWWAAKLSASMERALFGAGSADCRILIDLSGLMNGDFETRWKVGLDAVKAGVLTIDELRTQEGFNPLPAAPQPAPKPAAEMIG